MKPSSRNVAVIAAAGSGKTERIIDAALSQPGRVLITTYTNENLRQITRRIQEKAGGAIPPNVTVLGWFTFLINQCARPYQSALTTEINFIESLNFKGQRFYQIPRSNTRHFYFDKKRNIYRDGVADFVWHLNQATDGKVVRRLEAIFDAILIDEIQDMAGHDLDFIDLLFASSIDVTLVGDPRQRTFATNQSSKNSKFSGAGILDWLNVKGRKAICETELLTGSWRCNQAICDWADALFPAMPKTSSLNTTATGHDGVFLVASDDVADYVKRTNATVLRDRRTADTLGLPATNIGIVKGSTFDRVVIFPTQPMLRYIRSQNLTALTSPFRPYIAVTRARYSVAFVVESRLANIKVDGLDLNL